MAEQMQGRMEFRILGPLEADNEGRLLDLGGNRQQAVLAFLLLYPGQLVSSDRLLESLWGSPAPPGARNSLQSTISRLRQVLSGSRDRAAAAERITSRSRSYQLRVDHDELDSLRFERLLGEGRRRLDEGDPAASSSVLGQALALWRGQVLENLRSQGLEEAPITRLEMLRSRAVETKTEADLRLGRYDEVIAEAQAGIFDDQLNEPLRQHLMYALYQVGRAAQASDVYFDYQQLLEERSGMRPGEELRRLNQDIQRRQVQLAQPRRPHAHGATAPDDPGATVTTQDLGTTRNGTPAGTPEPLFVGYAAELQHMRDALTAVQESRGQLVLVAGDMGIGKSHLARQLAFHSEQSEIDAIWGRIWEEEGAPIYWPWVMIVRQILQYRGADWVRARLGTDAAVVAKVVTDLRELIPDLPAPPQLEPEQERFRLFDSFTRFLQRAVADRPMLFILDDLHRADGSTLMLLRFIARQMDDLRLLIVGTYRDSRGDQTEEFVRTLSQLTREPVTSRLTLRGLSEPEVAEFVERSTGQRITQQFASKLHHRTVGNPLFVKEIVHPLGEGVALEEFERGLETSVPQGVQEAIERRLAYIPEPVRDVLDRAAVIGQQFTLDLLAEVAGVPEADLLASLDQVIELDYITPAIGLGQNRYRFAHVLIYETLYRRLPTAKRTRIHLRVGEALEKVYAGDLEGRFIELAHHYSMAAGDTGSAKALDYLQAAGEQAVARLAFEDAVRLLQAALQQPTDRIRRCDILLALADAQLRAAGTARGRATYQQAADSAKALGDTVRLARAALGFGSQLAEFGRVNQQLIDLLEEARDALGHSEPLLRARVLSRLAEALYWVDAAQRPGVAEERAALSAEALRLVRGTVDHDALAVALHGRCYAIWRPENAEERSDLAVRLLEAAGQAGNWELLRSGRMWSVITALELGDMAAADAQIQAHEAEAERLGQPYLLGVTRIWQGTRALMQGRLDVAEELNRQARALAEQMPDPAMIENAATIQQWFLDDERGRRDALESALEGLADRFPRFRAWQLPLALMQLAGGDGRAAEQELERFASDGFDRVRRDADWLATMSLLAEIVAALGDQARAAELYELLAPFSTRYVVIGYAAVCRGSVAMQLGQLAALLGRWNDADQYFSTALTANRQTGARPALAATRYRYALALLRRDHGDDRDRAHDLLDMAERDGVELGMAGLCAEIASIAR